MAGIKKGRNTKLRRADLIGGIFMLALSLCMIFVVIPAETQEGVWFGLSPYFFPTLLMAGIAFASALLIVQSVTRPARGSEPPLALSPRQLAMFGIVAAIIVAGVVAIDLLGLWTGGPVLIAALMLFMGERRPLRIVATSIIPVAVVHLVVFYVLRSPLP